MSKTDIDTKVIRGRPRMWIKGAKCRGCKGKVEMGNDPQDICDKCFMLNWEEDPCNTCGGCVEPGYAGWCVPCRDKDKCRCDFCDVVKKGLKTASGGHSGYAVCMPCVREHQLTIC